MRLSRLAEVLSIASLVSVLATGWSNDASAHGNGNGNGNGNGHGNGNGNGNGHGHWNDSEANPGISEATQIDRTNRALSFDFAQQEELPRSIDGDKELVFVAEPLHARIAVIDRFSGEELGSLPAPPGGFILPFSLRVPEPGHLVVLDSGGFPDPNVPAVARVYDYNYDYSTRRGLRANLARTVRFDGLPVIFAEDVEVLPNGTEVVAESILGQLWVIKPNGTIVPGITPKTLDPADAIPQLAPCPVPDVQVDGIPYRLTGNIGPGVISLAQRNGYLYFGATCAGGIHKLPTSVLTDNRQPYKRAKDIVQVAAKQGAVDMLHGLAFNRAKPHERYVYATDSLNLRVIRVNTRTGNRQVLGDDKTLFNFPVSLHFLPPVDGLTPLVVASDQEHRFSAINSAISSDMFQPPFRLTKMLLGKGFGLDNDNDEPEDCDD